MAAHDRIRPSDTNPFYWQAFGSPTVLLGGSCEDNLFQLAGQPGPNGETLESELSTLEACGGNYLRCTLSSRDAGNLQPFASVGEGKYDLARWNEDYWARLRRFLEETSQRRIVIQIELFDPWDCCKYRGDDLPGWAIHPFNPRNNVNYSEEESGLPEVFEFFPFEVINPFFTTVPELSDLAVPRQFQEAFVDRVLAETLPFGHVLYCVDNESCVDPKWPAYWANFLKTRPEKAGVDLYVTQMWDNWDPTVGNVPGAVVQAAKDHPFLERANALVTIENADLYNFVDTSNHNTQTGRTHFETGYWVRQRVGASGKPRPINCVKMYGADRPDGRPTTNFGGGEADAVERFWRNLFSGLAAVRFHRPPTGLGLSTLAQKHLRAGRLLVQERDFHLGQPRPELIEPIKGNEAYCFGDTEQWLAVLLIGSTSAVLNLGSLGGEVVLRELDLQLASWGAAQPIARGESQIRHESVGKGPQVFLIERADTAAA